MLRMAQSTHRPSSARRILVRASPPRGSLGGAHLLALDQATRASRPAQADGAGLPVPLPECRPGSGGYLGERRGEGRMAGWILVAPRKAWAQPRSMCRRHGVWFRRRRGEINRHEPGGGGLVAVIDTVQ